MTLINDIKKDAGAGTPGPWSMETVKTSCGTCHKIGPFPSAEYFRPHRPLTHACIYDDYPPGIGHKHLIANARRIARVPDLERLVLELHGQNQRLREALEPFADAADEMDDCGYDDFTQAPVTAGQCRTARTALEQEGE